MFLASIIYVIQKLKLSAFKVLELLKLKLRNIMKLGTVPY